MQENKAKCNDPRCPVHGQLKTRGSRLIGLVVSSKAKKTAIVKVDYTMYLYKYERYLRKHSRIAAHNPECIGARVGDTVSLAETRRLSKTKSFAITGVLKQKQVAA
ncbi:MAG: 30S ribosomal protein S17 [Candidatus Micrarchaeota archaeon]|nr:30S ribosomal protein S17 [Candidatus Micrarchaeota archaeon]